jgi:hypothetical protein
MNRATVTWNFQFPKEVPVGNGAVELLKWVALVLMTGDHIDAALYGSSLWILSEAGRLAMPIFAAVFGFNLVRIGDDLVRLASLRNKLLLFACIAYPFHSLAVAHSWLTLNILFAFAVAVQIRIWDIDRSKNLVKILALFLVAGLFVEFAWVAPALVLVWFTWWRSPRAAAAIALVAVYVALTVVNNNFWAFGSLPIILLAGLADPQIPRWRQLFWIYYPAHLVVLAMLVYQVPTYVPFVSVPPAIATDF